MLNYTSLWRVTLLLCVNVYTHMHIWAHITEKVIHSLYVQRINVKSCRLHSNQKYINSKECHTTITDRK